MIVNFKIMELYLNMLLVQFICTKDNSFTKITPSSNHATSKSISNLVENQTMAFGPSAITSSKLYVAGTKDQYPY